MSFTPHGKHLIAGDWIASDATFASEPAHGAAHAFSIGSPCSRASGRPVSWVPIAVIASARASISSAMASRKAARASRVV